MSSLAVLDRIFTLKFRINGTPKPETALCIDISNALKERSRNGTLTCAWGKVSGEFTGPKAHVFGSLQKAMGVFAGFPDYIFFNGNTSAVIEVKVDTELSPAQVDYLTWCAAMGVRWAVCRSVPEVLATLREWGLLHDYATSVRSLWAR